MVLPEQTALYNLNAEEGDNLPVTQSSDNFDDDVHRTETESESDSDLSPNDTIDEEIVTDDFNQPCIEYLIDLVE